ncbi:MAG: hypothetical protein KBG15_02860 [Kofleriaceae bacterium]|nr:hypothetical protein [Kofleriaceae bacterium]
MTVALPGCKKDPVSGPGQSAGTAAVPATVAPNFDDPATCAGCHATIVAEFTSSMHASAHYTGDPIYAAMRTLRMQKEGPQVAAGCDRCHSPRAADAPQPVLAGVTCTSCHNLADVTLSEGKRGSEVMVRGPANVLRGPHDAVAGAATIHGTGAALGVIADGTSVCLACHQMETNAAGLTFCATGMEHDRTGPSCASCHMPEVATANGVATTRTSHRSHAFVGPHAAWQAQGPGPGAGLLATHLSIAARIDDDKLTVEMHNGSGHNFPSGFPGRLAVLTMQGVDAQGSVVWQNTKTDPMREHPDAVFNKVFVDAAGQPVLAPYGVKLARDNTLKPNETRRIVIAVPATVVRVDLALKYWLVAPPAAKLLQLAGLLTEPRVRVTATALRGGTVPSTR